MYVNFNSSKAEFKFLKLYFLNEIQAKADKRGTKEKTASGNFRIIDSGATESSMFPNRNVQEQTSKGWNWPTRS